MARITPIFVFAIVFFAFTAASGEFETIEHMATQWFSHYKPMPKEWQTFLANLAHPATEQNKTKLPAFIANFFNHTKSACSHELLSEILNKLKVWKAITGCYVLSATRETNDEKRLKMDFEKWNQDHVIGMASDPDQPQIIANYGAQGYIEILQEPEQEKILGDKNHIGKKLAAHFEIVMQYVGGILEKMKGCFKVDIARASATIKDEKELKERTSDILLYQGAIPLFEQLSRNKNALVAGMKHE